MPRIAALALAFVVATGCSSDKISGPSGPVENVSLDFCAFLRPTWMAVQNEGDVWKEITVPASGAITFDATERVSIAMVISFIGNFTFIYNVARDEMLGTPVFTECGDFIPGDRQLNGTVSGLGANDLASVSASFATTTTGFGTVDWSLTDLPNAATDLVATRIPNTFNALADRVIIRRALTPIGTAPIATLDFAGTEAVAPQSATLALAGGGSDFIDVGTRFITVNGTSHEMTYSGSPGSSFTFLSVPASLRIDSDIHELVATASNDFGWRDVTRYYKSPSTTSLTLGPMVGVPTISTVAAGPPKRMKALVAAQPQYPTAATVTFGQTDGCGEDFCDFRAVGVLTSAAFLGGAPTTWDVTIPDLSAAGYQASWGLANNAVPVEWDVTVFGSADGIAAIPTDGATLLTSSRSSASGITRMARQGRQVRPAMRLFGPLGPRRRQ